MAAQQECRSILRALADHRRVHVSIHAARKGIRRLRALLSILDGRIVDARPVDDILRKVGDSLSVLRDAHVSVVTAQRLAKKGSREAWRPAIDRLVTRRDLLLERALSRDPGFQRRQTRIVRVSELLDEIEWNKLRMSDLQRELRRNQRRVRKAEGRAKIDPSPENLHRWRRRARRLRMQLVAVEKAAPEVARSVLKEAPAGEVRALHKLSDQLGDLQDQEVLGNLLRRMRAIPQRAELLQHLVVEGDLCLRSRAFDYARPSSSRSKRMLAKAENPGLDSVKSKHPDRHT